MSVQGQLFSALPLGKRYTDRSRKRETKYGTEEMKTMTSEICCLLTGQYIVVHLLKPNGRYLYQPL
jgi:hypothetical protein